MFYRKAGQVTTCPALRYQVPGRSGVCIQDPQTVLEHVSGPTEEHPESLRELVDMAAERTPGPSS
jgi:hypothetical protein